MNPARAILILILAACAFGQAPCAETPLRVALMVPRDEGDGWVALGEREGLRRGIGEILTEVLGDDPAFTLADWRMTCGLAELVERGLYRFGGAPSHAGWRGLFEADIFVEYTVTAESLAIMVHGPSGTKTAAVAEPFLHPKQAAAAVVRAVYAVCGRTPDPESAAALDDPETRFPELFLWWMRWIGYVPSPWNSDNPYGLPNRTAREILERDPAFLRGLAWAASMRLRPVAVAGGKTAPASPEEFDRHVLDALAYARADFLIPGLRGRLKGDWLRRQVMDAFVFNELDREAAGFALSSDDADRDMPGAVSPSEQEPEPRIPAVRCRLVAALAGTEDAQLRAFLAFVAEKEEDAAVRAAAVNVLAGGERASLTPPRSGAPVTNVPEKRLSAADMAGLTDEERIDAMLADPSLRVQAAGLRLLDRRNDAASGARLSAVAAGHANEYLRIEALGRLMERDASAGRAVARGLLADPYWMVRLRAASLLAETAGQDDADAIDAAAADEKDPWIAAALTDARATSRGEPLPERARLNLGPRAYVEGGELPNGWQCWLGNMPANPAEAQRLVADGTRFGAKTVQPKNRVLWQLSALDDHRGNRNEFLLDLLAQLDGMQASLPFLHYLCLFDEPLGPGGGSGADAWRAFVLEGGMPELLDKKPDTVSEEIHRAFAWWRQRRVGDISNWVVAICRDTVQRRYPDLRLFPQTLSYMGQVDAFDMIDADGDYTWRYDGHHLFGDYGQGAVSRVLRPGTPVGKITWLGMPAPNPIRGDFVFTDTVFPQGPWRLRGYMGVCSALALYVSGVEAGFFNWVCYAPMARRGTVLAGRPTYPLTPHSKELTAVINGMIAEDTVYWNRLLVGYQGEDAPRDIGSGHAVRDSADDDEDDLAAIERDQRADEPTPAERRLAEEKARHFQNAMRGCSFMNIFHCDVTRAMANLPRPDTSRRESLVILPRASRWNADGKTFPMPALALLDGFDLAPTYAAAVRADLMAYDTILVLESPDGMPAALASALTAWLAGREKGLLYLAGDVSARKAFFSPWTGEAVAEPLPWEQAVRATAVPALPETATDGGAFMVDGITVTDAATRLRTVYEGAATARVLRDGKAVLVQWTPPAGTCTVLFDGAADAGPAYTEALERIVLEIDAARGATIRRNRFWGHVMLDTPQFTIDVATRGYEALQKARPRAHRGVDIISGVIHPTVTHGESALILTDYVGPYAGGKGDWAVMARTRLRSMEVDGARLKLHAEGVTRVTHIGPQTPRLAAPEGFAEVADQLAVWEAMWRGEKAYSVNAVEGGQEFHFISPDPVTILAE